MTKPLQNTSKTAIVAGASKRNRRGHYKIQGAHRAIAGEPVHNCRTWPAVGLTGCAGSSAREKCLRGLWPAPPVFRSR